MKFTMVRSAVITASLLACSATASDPTGSKSLLSRAPPAAGGSDFGPLVAEALRAAPARRDQLEADSGTDPHFDCKFRLLSGFVNIGGDTQIDFAFAQSKKSETTEDELPPLKLPSSHAESKFSCSHHNDLMFCLSKSVGCAGSVVYTDKFTVPEWLLNVFGGLPEDVFEDQLVAADDHPKREDGVRGEHAEDDEGVRNTGSATTAGALAMLLMQVVPVFLALW